MSSKRKREYKKYYKSCARGGEVEKVEIPYSTLYRWRKQGKCDDAALKELGIEINWREQRKAVKTSKQTSTSVDAADQILTPPGSFEVRDDGPSTSASPLLPPAEGQDITQSLVSSDTASSGMSEDSEDSSSYPDSPRSLDGNYTFSSDDSDDNVHSGTDNLTPILESKFIGTSILNQPLYPSLKVSKFETLLMIMHLSMRHSMTDVFIEDMVRFVNQIFGDEHCLKVSKYLFNKLFTLGSQAMMHFYCPTCHVYLGMESSFPGGLVTCCTCEWSGTVTSHNAGNYFLSLSIRDQIREVLSKPDVKFVTKDRTERVMTDMMDGRMYKSLRKEGNILSNPNALTITFNTDGAPVFNDQCGSIWPLQFFINELDLSQRFHTDNILLAGLWFGKKKANVQLLLRPFIDELNELQKRGVVWRRSDGLVVESPVYAVCCCTDSTAKPDVQNHHQFNGEYGCGYCEHPNGAITVFEEVKKHSGLLVGRRTREEVHAIETLDTDAEGLRQTIFRKKIFHRYLRGDYKLRTNRELREYMQLAAVSTRFDHIVGSTGTSALCDLRYFNVVYMFCIDYMHAVLLGNVKKLTNLWFDSTSDGKGYYIGRKVGLVDARLRVITMPSGFRKPRLMSHRVHWKANEFRAFLLYYALPVLDGILPYEYFHHFRKLVIVIHCFTKESITYDELSDATKLLLEWVHDYQDLYGEFNMVYNVHLMTHLGELVAHLGPLTTNSAFVFESANGRLVKLAHGTTGVATQICRKHIMTKSVPRLLKNNYNVSDKVIDYCCSLVGYRYLKNAEKGSCNETLLGRQYFYSLSESQQRAFENFNLPYVKTVCAVNRAVINGKMFHGRFHTKQKKACDSCVRLKTGEFALIDLIFSVPGEGVANDVALLVTKLNIATDPSPLMVPHIKECSICHLGNIAVIKATDISRKCVFYSCTDRFFVAEITNFFESD